MMQQYYLNHSALLEVQFKQNKDDFVVTEIPLYEFSGEGEHLILKVRKKDLATWDMIEILSNSLGCKSRDIGYAGLKDKNAMTVQYISLHKKFESKVESFDHPSIKILEKFYHNNKIRIGHLKGNKFFIRLKRVRNIDKKKLDSALKQIEKLGMANYFGYQRFGLDGDNHLKGKELLEGKIKVKNRNLKKMYISAYQSSLFNKWLSNRIKTNILINNFDAKEVQSQIPLSLQSIKELQKQEHPFKVFRGDLFSHYPYGRLFHIEDLESEAQKFFLKDRVPTGIINGKKTKLSSGDAYIFEKDFICEINEQGSRRFAWVFPSNIESNYNEEKNWYELSFELPKGSYATELIAELLHKDLRA